MLIRLKDLLFLNIKNPERRFLQILLDKVTLQNGTHVGQDVLALSV